MVSLSSLKSNFIVGTAGALLRVNTISSSHLVLVTRGSSMVGFPVLNEVPEDEVWLLELTL